MAGILKDSKTLTFWGLCVILLISHLYCGENSLKGGENSLKCNKNWNIWLT